ncbi:MAG: phosphate acyltransferase PlsX [Bacilli bacterium]|nr:phosphate acyltransferase PlsX [Bacilli bacterium]
MKKLAIDAMSGDLGSSIVVDACLNFNKKHKDVELHVTGKKEELTKLENIENIHIIDARDVLAMDEGILAVRRKKESSMVKAVMLAKEDKVDAVVSCGSTGSFYTCAMLFLKRIEGVEKSCLMAMVPTYNNKGVGMLDVGANAENTAQHLNDFAVMGSVYAKEVRGIDNPKVALLNIGTEEKKGNDMHKEAYQLLKTNDKINFVGNIEGRDMLMGDVDVVVTDGFSGNIALKTTEGVAGILMNSVKESMMSSLKGKIGALFAMDSLRALKAKFDYKSVGGALMMGFEKAVVKAHGASDDVAFLNAMELALKMVEQDVVNKMKEGLK